MTEKWIDKLDLFVHGHVDEAHNPGGMYQGKFRGATPECVGNGEIGVVLGSDNIQKRVVEDSLYGMIRELFLEPRRPVASVDLEFIDFSLVEFDRVIPMTHGNPILGVHEIRQDRAVHRVSTPWLIKDVLGAVGNVFAYSTPYPSEMYAGVPHTWFVRRGSRMTQVVSRQRRGACFPSPIVRCLERLMKHMMVSISPLAD